VDMVKDIIRFLMPFLVIPAALGAGYLLLIVCQQADQRHALTIKPPPAILTDDHPSSMPASNPSSAYAWAKSYDPATTLQARVGPPRGYERVEVDPEGFAHWLRGIPLRPAGTPVKFYNGQEKPNQAGHLAVVDIDVGDKDQQHGANAIIRLRAEYFFSRQKYGKIHYNFTNGTSVEFTRWAEGIKPLIEGNTLNWTKPRRNAPKDYSYASLRAYLDVIFPHASAASLSQEMAPVGAVKLMNVGNVFIQPSGGGHAVLVVDIAENKRNGAKCFLLAQADSPAQDIHILRNTRPADQGIWPWYDMNFGPQLATPDCKFNRADLKRFK
jgi:hypothetical protein